MNICAIILAAGQGTRFGQQKQFLNFKGKHIWEHIYGKVLKIIDKDDVVVVGVDIPGGITRTQSVICGMNYLSNKQKKYEKVLILEAARPLVSTEQMKLIIEDGHFSSTFALPLVNTVIKKDGTYVNREDYYFMSTPTCLNFELFLGALKTGKYLDLTDDTRIMFEEYGIKPFFFEGDERLLKITYKTDISILEMLSEKFGE